MGRRDVPDPLFPPSGILLLEDVDRPLDEASRAEFAAVWPLAKFPVIHDAARGHTVAESTIAIEYLDAFYPGSTRFLPADPDQVWQARMWDRIYDHYLHEPMQRIVGDRLRPAGKSDPFGVEQAVGQIRAAYALVEREIGTKQWAVGDDFSLADCAAAPALFYANTIVPFDEAQTNLARYLDRLIARPSFARASGG
jgi:glutathione S-transferase